MNTKYYNDAIIGNKNMTVSYSKTGEMLRLLYPNADYKQFIKYFHVGMKINDSGMIYLHNDINNIYSQDYVEDTNILRTEIVNQYFNVNVTQTDFVLMKENVLVKRYEIQNNSTIDLEVNLLVYSELLSNQNNQVSGYEKNDALIQYTHDYNFCIFSKEKIKSCQINNSRENIMDGVIGDKDYIGMSENSSISYDMGIIKAGEKKQIELFVLVQANDEKYNIHDIECTIERIKTIDTVREYQATRKYWRKYVKDHAKIALKDPENAYEQRVQTIYHRTILLYPLLINHETGGISAGVEVDEYKTKCGRYSYCWPRDAIFITRAMDEIGMEKETEKFYKNFCKNTQSRNGMWEQRFYTDGRLAPSWGYQIDETASVVYGVWEHYEHTKDEKFLKETLKMCEKAVEYLIGYVDKVLKEEEPFPVSYDLWEETESIHTYSLAAIFAAFENMIKIYEVVKPSFENNRIKLEKIRKDTEKIQSYLVPIKEYINTKLYDNTNNTFLRNKKDTKTDISLLGLVTPFKMFSPNEKKMSNTIEKMALTLRTYTGGYLRYENDNYMEGNNPWAISNLWLAWYYLENGENKKARECFNFVVKTSLPNGLLRRANRQQNYESKMGNRSWVVTRAIHNRAKKIDGKLILSQWGQSLMGQNVQAETELIEEKVPK